ncbi:MAG: class I SAM-dependent methyltransferase [Asgard group archaeon]|nr:class I SAM-dependent methyltransferase [Asgard group archaeon]
MNKSEKFWDKRAKEYDKQDKKYELSQNKAVENTIKYLDRNHKILDFGCGYGLITAKIAEYVKEVHGIDISSEMIDVAQRKAVEHNIENVSYTKATIFDDFLKEESYDVILAYNILHLLEDKKKVIESINKLLKPGGLFISETVCFGEKKATLGGLLIFLSKIKLIPYVDKMKFSDLDSLIVAENFQIIETEDLDNNSLNYFIVAKKQ